MVEQTNKYSIILHLVPPVYQRSASVHARLAFAIFDQRVHAMDELMFSRSTNQGGFPVKTGLCAPLRLHSIDMHRFTVPSQVYRPSYPCSTRSFWDLLPVLLCNIYEQTTYSIATYLQFFAPVCAAGAQPIPHPDVLGLLSVGGKLRLHPLPVLPQAPWTRFSCLYRRKQYSLLYH